MGQCDRFAPGWYAPVTVPYRAIAWLTSARGVRIIGLLASVGLAIGLTIYAWDFRLDDTLIYARYARNFGNGDGLVFNPGEHRNGTASYAYGLILGIPALLGVSTIPAVAVILTGAAIAATCALLILYLAPQRTPFGLALAGLGAIAYAGASLHYHALGVEIAPALLALTASFALIRHGRLSWAGAAAGAAVALRPELVFVVVPLAAALALESRPRAGRFGVPALLVVAPFVAFSLVYYGSLLPESFAARAAQADSGYFGPPDLYLSTAKGLLRALYLPWGYPVLLGAAAAIIADGHFAGPRLRLLDPNVGPEARAARRTLGVILGGLTLLSLYLGLADLEAHPWTLLPIVWALALGLPAACFLAVELVRASNPAGEVLARALAMIAIGTVALGSLLTLDGLPTGRDETAVRVATWLKANAGDDCEIGTAQPGSLGWYAGSGCRVVDLNGLLSDGNASALASHDLDRWLTRYQPRYVVAASLAQEAGAIRALLKGQYIIKDFAIPGRLILEKAAADANAGSLLGTDIGAGSVALNENVFSVGGVPRPALFMHAKGEHTFRRTVAAGHSFTAYIGIADGAERSDGVTFTVTIRDAGTGEEAVASAEVVRPGTAWREIVVAIPPAMAGRPIELTLSTGTVAGGRSDFGWAVWGEPRVGPK